MNEMKRIFVAVDISDEARRQTADYIQNLRAEFRDVRVGWEKPEKLHLTMKFLGDASDAQLAELQKIVGEIAAGFSDFNLEITQTGVFPNARSPRVLWIDIRDAAGNLGKINELLETHCAKLGFERERRKFVPHLTIGRVREPHRARELAQMHLENEFSGVASAVSEIFIYESRLLPSGSVYAVVSKHKFG